ncbi:MAG TPA: hypothetical protein VGR03_15625 [Candidatus Acidoferrum sp.]|nr:hypothetical protein [Candidatus Acidoferrum sp.]
MNIRAITAKFAEAGKPFLALWGAVRWIGQRFWTWELVSWLVGVVFVGLAFVLAQYGWYLSGRLFLVLGAILLILRIVHDAMKSKDISVAEKIVASIIVTAVLSGICAGGSAFINDIEWKNEIRIHLSFKSSPLFTKQREKKIIWELNSYYRYLTELGLDLSPEIPPLGITPPHGPMSAGGQPNAPFYYSSLYISEDVIDNPDMVKAMYSTYIFGRLVRDSTNTT